MNSICVRSARLLPVLLATAVIGIVSGCATITGSETQNVSLQALDSSGAAVAEAECKLTNDKGSWRAKPPSITMVTRSAEDLMIQCNADGQQPGTLRAISRANAGMVGNIIFGGAIGAVIDHSKGTAYDYPTMLRVIFGTSQVVDKGNERGGTPAMTSLPPPAAASSKPTPGSAGVASAPASAGLPAPGATYRYAWVERQYSRQQEFTVKVAAVQGWNVSESFAIRGAPEASATVNARNPSFVGRRLADGQSLLEFAPYLPVQSPGDTPTLPEAADYPTGGYEPWSITVQPLDWDQVVVPAGGYRALRLEMRGVRTTYTTQYARAGIAERFELIAWYSPELKRYVKLQHRQWNGFKADMGDESVELLEYQAN